MTSTENTPIPVDIATIREEAAYAVLSSVVESDSDPADPAPWLTAADRMNSDHDFRERMVAAELVIQMGGKTDAEWTADGFESLNNEYDRQRCAEEVIDCYRYRARAARFLPIVTTALREMWKREYDDDQSYQTHPVNMFSLITFECPDCNTPMRAQVNSRPNSTFGIELHHQNSQVALDAGCRLGSNALLRRLQLGSFVDGDGLNLSFLDDDEIGQQDNTDWLISGMFARGDYWSLFGPSEVGKSLLALDWSIQMARNGERVLYLDRENPKAVLEARLRNMGARHEDFVNLLLKPFVEIKDLAAEAGAEELRAMVKKHGATVVILDTISKFSEVGQASQSDRWQKMYNHSFVPLLKSGVSVGQLDHTGLADKTRERDSGAKRDNVSVAWALTWRGKDKLNLNRAKNRPNYSSPGALVVDRIDEPFLTHIVREAVPDEIRKALEELERLGVPEDAGRNVARDYLKRANHSMSDALLNKALKARKDS